jgi:hypothetical protein
MFKFARAGCDVTQVEQQRQKKKEKKKNKHTFWFD